MSIEAARVSATREPPAGGGGCGVRLFGDASSVPCAPRCGAHESFGCEFLDQWECMCGATSESEPFDLSTFGLIVYAADVIPAAAAYDRERGAARASAAAFSKFEFVMRAAVRGSMNDDGLTGASCGTPLGGAAERGAPLLLGGPRPRRKWDCGNAGRGCLQRQELKRHLLSAPAVRLVSPPDCACRRRSRRVPCRAGVCREHRIWVFAPGARGRAVCHGLPQRGDCQLGQSIRVQRCKQPVRPPWFRVLQQCTLCCVLLLRRETQYLGPIR
jgi:hypothetical protein